MGCNKVKDELNDNTNRTTDETCDHIVKHDNVPYKYPPPTQFIINNMANTIASVPQLYTQVLDLMNKMNLPSPLHHVVPPAPLLPSGNGVSDESEIESDKDDHFRLVY
jgi:hypothetical protein